MIKWIFATVLTFCMVGVGQADMFPAQTIDFTSSSNPYWNASDDSTMGKLIENGSPFNYQHDLNALVSLPGDVINSATLELYFIDEETDNNPNKEEYVQIAFDGSAWTALGEVDTGARTYNVTTYINTDGILNVSVDVLNTATGVGVVEEVYLNYSTLSGEYTPYVAEPVPVPGAVLLGMLGLCVAGVKLRKYA